MDFAVDATLVGLVMALVQMAKSMGLPVKYAPLLALVVGIGFVAGRQGSFDYDTIYAGILTGLIASGLYLGAKAVTQ